MFCGRLFVALLEPLSITVEVFFPKNKIMFEHVGFDWYELHWNQNSISTRHNYTFFIYLRFYYCLHNGICLNEYLNKLYMVNQCLHAYFLSCFRFWSSVLLRPALHSSHGTMPLRHCSYETFARHWTARTRWHRSPPGGQLQPWLLGPQLWLEHRRWCPLW